MTNHLSFASLRLLRAASFAIALSLLFALSIPATSFAADEEYPEGKIKLFGKRFSLALTLSGAGPTSSKFENQFGGAGFGFGLTLFRPEMKTGLRFDPDVQFAYFTSQGREALIAGLGAGIHYNFVDPKEESAVPFFELHADPYYVNLTGDSSAIVGGLNAALGMEFNDTVSMNIRSDYIGQVKGYDPSLWSADVTVKVW